MYFQVYEDNAGEWRWRLRANNHEIVGDSAEGYTTKPNCHRAIRMLQREIAAATIQPEQPPQRLIANFKPPASRR